MDASSNAYWAQLDVELTVDRPLTQLTVELRVVRTPGVVGTGSFSSFGQASETTTVEGEVLVYRWVLQPGSTLPAGTYTFAGQFQHDPGQRDAGGDRFTVTGDGPGGTADLVRQLGYDLDDPRVRVIDPTPNDGG